MADQTATASPASAEPKTPRSIASSISESIQKKAAGATPASNPPITDQKPEATPPADQNAGKEKYVVDGKEVWVTPKEREVWVQKGMSFEPRVDELARLRSETQAFLKTLSTDPLKILTDKRIGMTPELVLEKIFKSGHISDQMKEAAGRWYYENVVEPAKLSPEQLKAREDAKWRTNKEAQEKEQQENVVRQENANRVARAMATLKSNIAEAMKDSGLPNNDSPVGAEMARMVADTIRVAHRQSKSITPKQAIEFVKQRMKTIQVAYYDSLDAENLVKEIGESNAEKVKQYFLKLASAGAKPPVLPGAPRATRTGERKTISQDDFHDYLDELKKKG